MTITIHQTIVLWVIALALVIISLRLTQLVKILNLKKELWRSRGKDSISGAALLLGEGDDYISAKEYVLSTGKASTTALQTAFRWGYTKAERILSLLEKDGVISAHIPGKQYREVLAKDIDD